MKRHMQLVTVLFIFVLPVIVKAYYNPIESYNESSQSAPQDTNKDTQTAKPNRNKKYKIKTKTEIRNKSNTVVESIEHIEQHEKLTKATKDIPWYILPLLNVLCVFILFGIIFFSPNNIAVSRLVYVAPLLRPQEAQTIISMANAAALRNTQLAEQRLHEIEKDVSKANPMEVQKLTKLLQEPKGWTKDRHDTYPTTDLNVVIHFDRDEKAFISKILHARLSPVLERLYGVPRDAIRANDMFVVRYDHDGQNRLAEHTDSSHISFNVLLNDEFEGGGTSFLNRKTGDRTVARPRKGDVLLNNAMVTHEGLKTTNGTRYIFVGFLSVDPRDPWTGKWKDMSWFVTFFSFPWLTVSLKEQLYLMGFEKPNRGETTPISTKDYYILGMLAQLVIKLGSLGDLFAPHRIVNLVDTADRNKYIEVLDEFDSRYGNMIEKASWFSGQQIRTSFDGTLLNEWDDRVKNRDRFEEL
jgi:hypothetical protein